MEFTPLDLTRCPRGQVFYYFSQVAPTGYSLTVTLDVTALRGALQRAKVKFFPAYLWLATKNLNAQPECKMAVQNGQLGYYDQLCPLYAAFHEDDKTFSLMWTEYRARFGDFYAAYLQNQKKYGAVHGILSQPAPPPPNAYTISCLPWVQFEHFSLHSYENKPYYFPTLEAGRFYERAGRWLLPLSITCHHAATDGWHVKRFLEGLQADMDAFASYL